MPDSDLDDADGFEFTQSICPIYWVVDLLARKWTIPILRELFHSRQRPTVLLRKLTGLSAKTLAERLRDLERAGIIERTVYPEVPPRVEYCLSPLGQQLRNVLISMKEFAGERRHSKSGGAVCDSCLVEVTEEACPLVGELVIDTAIRQRNVRKTHKHK